MRKPSEPTARARHFVWNGRALKAARKTAGLSLAGLCAAIVRAGGRELNPDTIRRWELSICEPDVSVLYTIARVLRTPADRFLEDQARRSSSSIAT